MAGPAGEELLDAAVGKGALNGKGLRELDFNVVAGGEMKAAVNRLLALGSGVAEGEHLAAGIHGHMEPGDDGSDKRFGKVVEGGPQEHYVEHAAGKIERLVQEAFDIPDGLSIFIGACGPIAVVGVMDQVGEEDAMAQAGEVIDVCGRGVADVDDAQSGLALQPLAHLGPAAGMTRDARPRESGSGRGGATDLLLFEPTA